MTDMQVTTEELEYCKVKVKYQANSDVVSKKTKEAINQLRGMNVPGFRPGKASDLAIKVRFKDRIKQWVEREMLNEANNDILFETKMRPLSRPQVEKQTLEGNNFSCEMVYMKKPDIELKEFKGLEIPKPNIEKDEFQVAEEMLQKIREQNAESRPYDENEFVQNGDKITIRLEVSDGTTDEGIVYKVGESLYPDFDENLYGMSIGETREFAIKVDGKKETCKVTVNMGMKPVPAPLDDSFAQRVGVKSFGELQETLTNIAKDKIKQMRDELVGDQIKKRLVADHDFEAPPWLVTMESQHLAGQEGLKWPELEQAAQDKYIERAKDNVKFTLILDAIREKEKETELSDNEAVEMVRQVALRKGLQNVDEWLQKSMKDGSLYGLVAKAKNDYTMQWLIDNAKVIE